MSRPKSDPWYRSIAFDLWGTNERLSTAAVMRGLEKEAEKVGRTDSPSESTVRRWREEFRQLSAAQRLDYGLARWPDAMESGALPWEASASLMELLTHALAKGAPPSVRLARWHFHVSLAAPDAPWHERLRVSGYLTALEMIGSISDKDRRAAEGYLAFKPWTEQGAALYGRLVKEGKITDLRIRGIAMTTEMPRDITTAIFDMWIPGLPVSITNLRVPRRNEAGLDEDEAGGSAP